MRRPGAAARSLQRNGPATVIRLAERSLAMQKNDIRVKNPLRLLGETTGQALSPGGFGAVIARAGVGKTAVLVQIAMDGLLAGKNVLHVSLDQPVQKVCLWYEEVFSHAAKNTGNPLTPELWEAVLKHRFIMSFPAAGFTVERLEGRVTDLADQDIFYPQMAVVDGLPFDETARERLQEMKLFARENRLSVWFAVRAHRDDVAPGQDVPESISRVLDLFDVALKLTPEERDIRVEALPGKGSVEQGLVLDPASLLIREAGA